MMTEFHDEPTPLPVPAVPRRDPRFPTGYVPKIDVDHEVTTPGALYPSWRFTSPCTTVDEMARLFAPYFDGTSLYLFTNDVKEPGVRVELEVSLATGERVLAGVAEVTESHPRGDSRFGHPGMRFQFRSVDDGSDALLVELGDIAAPIRELVIDENLADPRRTMQMSGLPPRDDATTKMSALQIADIVGVAPAHALDEWNDLLMCKLDVTTSGECATTPDDHEPHETSRTVISELADAPPAAAAAPTSVAEPLDDLPEIASAAWWTYRWWLVAAVAAAFATTILLALR